MSSLAGSGSPDDPFFLLEESDDSYVAPPEENHTPVPIRVPAYPGGNYTRKGGRQGQRAQCGGKGKAKMVALGRNISSEEVSLERASVGHALSHTDMESGQ